jgi:hypothetical protein
MKSIPRSITGELATAITSIASGNKSNVKIACTEYDQINSILKRDKWMLPKLSK